MGEPQIVFVWTGFRLLEHEKPRLRVLALLRNPAVCCTRGCPATGSTLPLARESDVSAKSDPNDDAVVAALFCLLDLATYATETFDRG